jgi:hypothetical protein
MASVLSRFIGGRVLEVGARIGSSITYLHTALVREWTSLEPDGDFARRIEDRGAVGELPPTCRVIAGTIERSTRPLSSISSFTSTLWSILQKMRRARPRWTASGSRRQPHRTGAGPSVSVQPL